MPTDKWVLSSPLRIPQTKKKDFILNLNVYRNAHYRTLNTIKIRYKEHMKDQIEALPEFSKYHLKFVVYPATKRKFDVSNVCSIHDKFFCDALQELGKTPEDDYEHLPKVLYQFGEVDKENPRVEIHVLILEDQNGNQAE